MRVLGSLLLFVLLTGCLYSEKPLFSEAIDTDLPEAMMLVQGRVYDDRLPDRGAIYYIAEILPNGSYGITDRNGQQVYTALPVKAEDGFIFLQVENTTTENEEKRFTYGLLGPAPNVSDKVDLYAFVQPVYLAEKHKVLLEQINVQTKNTYALVSDQNQLEQALSIFMGNEGVDAFYWRILDLSNETETQEAEEIAARFAPPPPPEPPKVRESAKHCLVLTRNSNTRTVYVANSCQREIMVSVCTLSKTNLALKLLGSWVADEECRYARGTQGPLTSFFFANINDAPIWNMLSDASYRVSATFAE